MSDTPRSSTETIIRATSIIAKWHEEAAFKDQPLGDATDHLIYASALTEAADRLAELNALTGQPPSPHAQAVAERGRQGDEGEK